MKISNLKSTYFSPFFVIVVLLVLFNFFVLKSAILGLILGILWLVWSSFSLGKRIVRENSNLAYGLFVLLTLVIVLGAAFFYGFNFGDGAVLIIFVLVSGLVFTKTQEDKNVEIDKIDFNWRRFAWLSLYLGLLITAWVILFNSQTAEAVRSPWEVVPRAFFVIYFLAGAVLVKIIQENPLALKFRGVGKNTKISLVFISLFYFLTFGVVLVVYKIGFGFDPFVHRAAEYKLAELGYILPKPFYYIGQYSLVVWLAKIFTWPIVWVDKLLVPVLAGIFLPSISYYSLKNFISDKRILLITVCLLLVVFAPLFFYTVPQGLANLWLVVLVFLLLAKKLKLWQGILIVLATAVIHPLTGIPAFIILIFYYFNILPHRINKIFKLISIVLASILVPLFFVGGSMISNRFKVGLGVSNLGSLRNLFNGVFNYLPFYSIYHLIYLYKFNLMLVGGLVFAMGIVYMRRQLLIKGKQLSVTRPDCNASLANHGGRVNYQLSIFFILTANLILLGFLKFESVINYEQGEFIKRFGQIILLALSPILMLGAYFGLKKILLLKKSNWIILVLVPAILTMNLYVAYPHIDAFEKNRGYSVSAADIQAVHWINQDGGDEDYVVLANQSVSAAGLQEFGFYKYVKTQNLVNKAQKMIFYYPIPTSSLLYNIYLKMVYGGPSLELIEQTRELTGVERVYFVINDYWLDAEKRVEQAREKADFEVNFQGKVWVFRFE